MFGSNVVALLRENPPRSSLRSVLDLRDATQAAVRDSGAKYKDLARRAGLCATTVSNIAAGVTREPRASTCMSLLLVLGYSLHITKD